MKDFAQAQVVLRTLDKVQKDLISQMESSENWLNDYKEDARHYLQIENEDGVEYFKEDEDGERYECSKWDYTYAINRVLEQEKEVNAYKAIIEHLDSFKY